MDTTISEDTFGRRIVVGVFDAPRRAERALHELRSARFSPERVAVIVGDTREARLLAEQTSIGDGEAAGAGMLLGGFTGGLLGWLVGISTLAIPGVGPVVVAGALAATVGGAAVGVAAGKLAGALVDHGVPEAEARGYEGQLGGGAILLIAETSGDEETQRTYILFERHGSATVRFYARNGERPTWAPPRERRDGGAPSGPIAH